MRGLAMPYVVRPTCTLHYEDMGPSDAPAVMLLPSLLCDGRMFSHLAAHLADRYRVLSVDMRGHGRSSTPIRAFTMEDQADDVAAVLDDAGVRSASLVGLSQGGMTAMRAAIYHPSRVRALALLDSSAEPEGAFVRTKYMAMAATFRAIGLTKGLEKAVKPLMFGERFLRARPDVVEENAAQWRELDGRAVYYATRSVALRTDFTPFLSRIEVPTLVLVGTGDRALPVARSQRLAEAIRGADFVTIEGAGHLSTIEEPEQTTQVVARFLEAKVGGAAS
jgi:pimeloyl-ACP methyl ester carboxylesterase